MTNYNERLDEILDGIDKAIETRILREPLTEDAWMVEMRLRLKKAVTTEAKQAITSLIKELVAEAKPYGKRQFRELIEDAWYEAPTAAAGFGRIEAIHNQYEQNLLKALEEL